jgi:hypothetical protein
MSVGATSIRWGNGMNAKKVPQLFVATGATKWGDPQHFPDPRAKRLGPIRHLRHPVLDRRFCALQRRVHVLPSDRDFLGVGVTTRF